MFLLNPPWFGSDNGGPMVHPPKGVVRVRLRWTGDVIDQTTSWRPETAAGLASTATCIHGLAATNGHKLGQTAWILRAEADRAGPVELDCDMRDVLADEGIQKVQVVWLLGPEQSAELVRSNLEPGRLPDLVWELTRTQPRLKALIDIQ